MENTKNKFIDWLCDLLKDERGVASINPVVALIGSVFLCVTMLINSFAHREFEPSYRLIEAVVIITIIGLGADTVDKFTHKNSILRKSKD